MGTWGKRLRWCCGDPVRARRRVQVDYSSHSERWNMPARYFAKEYHVGAGAVRDVVRLVVIDACLLMWCVWHEFGTFRNFFPDFSAG